MGHDGHFLERLDRVSREQTDLALELYRDHDAVRHLLDREQLPRETERIAIALGDEDGSPHVIVARDGHFVTCLGAGMSPRPWPVLPRKALMGSLGFASDMRRRKQTAKEIARTGEDEIDLLTRITKRKNRLSREEIIGISAFAPLFAHDIYVISAKRASDVVQAALISEHPAREGIERHTRQVWAAAYGVEVCGTVEERIAKPIVTKLGEALSFSTITSHLADHTFVLRGIWAASMVGPRLVRSYLSRFDRALSAMKALDACLGLAAIALRHEDARDEIERELAARTSVRRGTKLDNVFAAFAGSAINTIQKADVLEDAARKFGALSYFMLASAKLEPGMPGHFASEDEVPPDLAETAYLNEGGSLETDPEASIAHLFGGVALLAKVSVGAFHYPGALVKSLVEPWGEEHVRAHFRQLRASRGITKPMRYDAKVGRNEACPCGSGKKSKKCCAG